MKATLYFSKVSALTALDVRGKYKALSDVITVTDSIAFTITYQRELTESITATDQFNFEITRPLTDSVTMSDVLVVDFSKGLADSITVSDTIDIVTSYGPSLSDSVTADMAAVWYTTTYDSEYYFAEDYAATSTGTF